MPRKSRTPTDPATRPGYQPWTPEQTAQLRRLYPDTGNAALGRLFGRSAAAVAEKAYKLGLRKSDAHLQDHAGRLSAAGNVHGVAHRFQPGHAPWNKGKPFNAGGASAGHRFGPGHRPHTWVPVGTLRITSDGYVQRKVSDTGYPPRDWLAVHRLVWEDVHGPTPAGHVVVFRAGCHTTDADAITLEHVELITRAELMRRNSVHRHGPEVAALSQLRGALHRQINRRLARESRDRDAADPHPHCNPEGTP